MQSTWKNFLNYHHQGNEDYNNNAGVTQQKFQEAVTANQRCNHLKTHRTLICLTRTALSEEIQPTFFHEAVTTSITQNQPV